MSKRPVNKAVRDTFQSVSLYEEILLAEIGGKYPPEQIEAALEALRGTEMTAPPGERRLPPDLVGTLRHMRLKAAVLSAFAELGWRATTIREIERRSGVYTTAIYTYIAHKEELLLQALDDVVRHLKSRVGMATLTASDDPLEAVRSGLRAILRFVSEEPDAARALIVEGPSRAPIQQRYEALIEHFASCLDARMREAYPDKEPPRNARRKAAHGVASALHGRLVKRESKSAPHLLAELTDLVVAQYRGEEAAAAQRTPER